MAPRVLIVVGIIVALALLSWWQHARLWESRTPVEEPGAEPARPTATDVGAPEATPSPGIAFEACVGARDEEPAPEPQAAIDRQQQEMLRVLSASADAEHLFAAALSSWRDDSDRAMSLLGEAAALEPRHPLIASQLLMLCAELVSCDGARPELERNLIAADKGNALAWVQVAGSRLQRDNERGALSALREAAAAAAVADYFSDYVMLFDRGLAAASSLEPFDRMVAAVGHAAAVFDDTYRITADCQERAANHPEWRDGCLRLGERFEHDGQTLLTQAIGMRLQANMYTLEGDTRAAEGALRRREELDVRLRELASRTARAEELRDARVVRQFIETFASAGELEAMEYLAGEVEARLPPLSAAEQARCGAP